MIEETLQNIGLTKSEARVYLSLLELGKSSTGKIVEHAKVSSSKIYELLEKLSSKGLVTYIIEGAIKQYEAVDPTKILDYLQEKQVELQTQVKSVKELLPQLQLKKELSKHITNAQIYKGQKGLQSAFDETASLLNEGDEYLTYGIPIRSDVENRYFQFHNESMSNRKISCKLLFNDMKQLKEFSERKIPYREVRYMFEKTPASITIAKNRTVIFPISEGEPIIFVIDNKEVAESFRAQFETFWNRKTSVTKGFNALGDVLDKLMVADKSFCCLGASFGPKLNRKEYESFFNKWAQIRKKRNVTALLLCNPDSKEPFERLKNSNYNTLAQIKYLPTSLSFPVEIYPSQDCTYIVSHDEEPEIITIEDKEIATAFKSQFDLLWDQRAQILTGIDQISQAFNDALDSLSAGESFEVLGIPKRSDDQNKFFIDWNNRATKRKIMGRMIVNTDAQYDKQFISAGSLHQIKFLPQTTPASVNIFKNRVIFFPANESTAFQIDSKEIADSFRAQFESQWNQQSSVEKGWPALQHVFDILHSQKNSTYKVLGAAFGSSQNQQKYNAFFKVITDDRIKKNITAKLLFNQASKEHVEKEGIKYQVYAQLKYLPYESRIPVEIYPHKEKTYIVIQDKEPEVITINNSTVSQAFEQQFDALWNQDVQVFKGVSAIDRMFDELIDICKAGDGYITYGAHYGNYSKDVITAFERGTKKRVSANVHARLLFYPDQLELVNKHHDTTSPLTQIRYLDQTTNAPTELIVARNVVFLNILTPQPTVIRLESESFAESLRIMFENEWSKKSHQYVGEDGVKIFFEEALKHKDVYFIGGNFGIAKYFTKYWQQYKQRRVTAKCTWHDLLEPDCTQIENLSNEPYYEYKFMPKEIKSPLVIAFFGNTVGIILWRADRTTIQCIEDNDLVMSYKTYFKYYWDIK